MKKKEKEEWQNAQVRQYLEDITDCTLRKTCEMLMHGLSDAEVCKVLKITLERLDLMKMQLASEMKNLGIVSED